MCPCILIERNECFELLSVRLEVRNHLSIDRGLCLGRERRKREAKSENDREPDQPHEHLGGGWLGGSLAERRDVHQRGAAH
jgi:hypothetical protein